MRRWRPANESQTLATPAARTGAAAAASGSTLPERGARNLAAVPRAGDRAASRGTPSSVLQDSDHATGEETTASRRADRARRGLGVEELAQREALLSDLRVVNSL